jgi:two-component system phosphate regulon response regulator PhoB/two-component system alkaline phosphatase synthesis response regulator PhoP
MSSLSAQGQPVSILVADDEDSLRDVICLHLRGLGYEVHEARDGAEALQMAQTLLPALIVLDITMPKLNGWEVARRLRGESATAGIKLLMLSGIGEEVLGAGLPVLGGDIGLDKPFELEELEEALAQLLKS